MPCGWKLRRRFQRAFRCGSADERQIRRRSEGVLAARASGRSSCRHHERGVRSHLRSDPDPPGRQVRMPIHLLTLGGLRGYHDGAEAGLASLAMVARRSAHPPRPRTRVHSRNAPRHVLAGKRAEVDWDRGARSRRPDVGVCAHGISARILDADQRSWESYDRLS